MPESQAPLSSRLECCNGGAVTARCRMCPNAMTVRVSTQTMGDLMPVGEHEAEVKYLREQNDGLYAAVQMAQREQERLRAALELIASVRGPLIEADPATLGHGFEQIARDALASPSTTKEKQ